MPEVGQGGPLEDTRTDFEVMEPYLDCGGIYLTVCVVNALDRVNFTVNYTLTHTQNGEKSLNQGYVP